MAKKRRPNSSRGSEHKSNAARSPATIESFGPPALIVLLTLAAYARSLGNGFIWDDPDYVINNPTLRSFAGLWEMWTHPASLPQWYPMVHTTFWVEYHLWGLWTPGYHIVNAMLHAINALLVWRLLRKLDIPGALVAAALFAVHPITVESVAWITERKNLLSCAFYLGAAIAYLKSGLLDHKAEESPPPIVWRWYGLSLALFAAALFSKTVTASLPAALLVLVWWKFGSVRWKDIKPTLPFFVLGAVLGTITAFIEHNHVGARAELVAELNLSPAQRVLIAGRAIWFYVFKIVWPHDLNFIYPRWEVDPHVPWQWMFPAAVLITLGVVLLLMRLRRIGRGTLAVALLFIGTLFPALGFVNVYPMRFSFVADHFQYHASISLLAGLSAAAFVLLRRAKLSDAAIYKLFGVPIVLLAFLTFLQTARYLDAETLWRITSRENPKSWMVWINLGNALVRQGRYDEAAPCYETALRFGPGVQEAWWNVGNVRARDGRVDDAEAAFRKAVELTPQFARGYDSLGKLYFFRRKDPPTAERYYRQAIDVSNGSLAEAHFDLGVLLDQTGRTTDSLDAFKNAIAGQADYADAHESLAGALLKLQRFDEAIYNLKEVLRIRPDNVDARINLGWALIFIRDASAAAEQFSIALSGRPGDPRATKGLALARGH